jgi:hypothetical protein
MRRVDQCYELLLYIQGVHSYVMWLDVTKSYQGFNGK